MVIFKNFISAETQKFNRHSKILRKNYNFNARNFKFHCWYHIQQSEK